MTLMIRPLALLRHRRLRTELDAFVDDELDVDKRAAVADHIDECPGCSQITRQLMRIKKSLRLRYATPVAPAEHAKMKAFADELISS